MRQWGSVIVADGEMILTPDRARAASPSGEVGKFKLTFMVTYLLTCLLPVLIIDITGISLREGT